MVRVDRVPETRDTIRPALQALTAAVDSTDPIRPIGTVTDFAGLLVESEGRLASLGDICEVRGGVGSIRTQVVGFRSVCVLSMPLEETVGLQPGSPITAHRFASQAPGGMNLLGRVVDAFRSSNRREGYSSHARIALTLHRSACTHGA